LTTKVRRAFRRATGVVTPINEFSIEACSFLVVENTLRIQRATLLERYNVSKRRECPRPARPSKRRVLLHPDYGRLIVVDLSRRLVAIRDWRRLIDVIDWRGWSDVSLRWCLIVHFGRLWYGTFCRNVAGTSQWRSRNIIVRHFESCHERDKRVDKGSLEPRLNMSLFNANSDLAKFQLRKRV